MVCLAIFIPSVVPFLFCRVIRSSSTRSELFDCMIGEGILRVIGDIIVTETETDDLVLVCLLSFFYIFHLLFLFFTFAI